MSTATPTLAWAPSVTFPGIPNDGSMTAELPTGGSVVVSLARFGDPTSGWTVARLTDDGATYLASATKSRTPATYETREQAMSLAARTFG